MLSCGPEAHVAFSPPWIQGYKSALYTLAVPLRAWLPSVPPRPSLNCPLDNGGLCYPELWRTTGGLVPPFLSRSTEEGSQVLPCIKPWARCVHNRWHCVVVFYDSDSSAHMFTALFYSSLPTSRTQVCFSPPFKSQEQMVFPDFFYVADLIIETNASKYFIWREMLVFYLDLVYFLASWRLKTCSAVGGGYKWLILAFPQVEHILSDFKNIRKIPTILHPALNTCRGCVDASSDYFMRGAVKHRQEINLQDV